MKKNIVHRNGMNWSVRCFRAGRATSSRMNNSSDSNRFMNLPRGRTGSAPIDTYDLANMGKINRHRPAATSVISS